jgi:CRISPR type I-E-associated protein CasB/Cse2
MSRICLDWWDDLTGVTDRKTCASGPLADLRRARDLLDVCLCPAYHRLVRRMPWLDGTTYAGRRMLDRLAVVAYVLAQVRKHDARLSVASQMATPKKGKSTSPVSELRFRRLMQVRTDEELMAALRRTVELLKESSETTANVADLSDLILHWGQPSRMHNTAFQYYAVVPEKPER